MSQSLHNGSLPKVLKASPAAFLRWKIAEIHGLATEERIKAFDGLKDVARPGSFGAALKRLDGVLQTLSKAHHLGDGAHPLRRAVVQFINKGADLAAYTNALAGLKRDLGPDLSPSKDFSPEKAFIGFTEFILTGCSSTPYLAPDLPASTTQNRKSEVKHSTDLKPAVDKALVKFHQSILRVWFMKVQVDPTDPYVKQVIETAELGPQKAREAFEAMVAGVRRAMNEVKVDSADQAVVERLMTAVSQITTGNINEGSARMQLCRKIAKDSEGKLEKEQVVSIVQLSAEALVPGTWPLKGVTATVVKDRFFGKGEEKTA